MAEQLKVREARTPSPRPRRNSRTPSPSPRRPSRSASPAPAKSSSTARHSEPVLNLEQEDPEPDWLVLHVGEEVLVCEPAAEHESSELTSSRPTTSTGTERPGTSSARTPVPTHEAFPSTLRLILFYFSGRWCPLCREFDPLMLQVVREFKAQQQDDLEFLWLSLDLTAESYKVHLTNLRPMIATEWVPERTLEAFKHFGVTGAPALLVIDAHTGEIVTSKGREDILEKTSKGTTLSTPRGSTGGGLPTAFTQAAAEGLLLQWLELFDTKRAQWEDRFMDLGARRSANASFIGVPRGLTSMTGGSGGSEAPSRLPSYTPSRMGSSNPNRGPSFASGVRRMGSMHADLALRLSAIHSTLMGDSESESSRGSSKETPAE